MQVPTETNMQEIVNRAINTAIPALVTAVDDRVGEILGTAITTMEAAADRVEVATQRKVLNPRRTGKKRLVTLDEYDGDTEVTPKKSGGPKSAQINKQHVCFRLIIILFPNNFYFWKECIRKWLADRGVLRTKENIPISATDDEVAGFDINHAGGPITGLPVKIHWKSGFSSDWNRQAIFVLASDFLAEHTSCTITEDDLRGIFVSKLQRTRREWTLMQTMQTQEFERLQAETAKQKRKRGRLYGVS